MTVSTNKLVVLHFRAYSHSGHFPEFNCPLSHTVCIHIAISTPGTEQGYLLYVYMQAEKDQWMLTHI